MKSQLKILFPILVLVAGGIGAKALKDSRVLPEAVELEVLVPRVRSLEANPGPYQVFVQSQGTVVPRLESQLVSEVAGRVLHVSPNLVNGGFFEADEVLLRIDPRDFELALTQAKLEVARAQRRLQEEEADARVARREWESMGQGEPTALALHIPQIEEAQASVNAAVAIEERAQRNLERTEVKAAFQGRVRTKQVDVGQFVAMGSALATLYAIDVAEIRLPLADGELAFLELPYGASKESQSRRPTVQLSSEFAGLTRSWQARIVRTEGEIDPMTRMVMAVAEVQDPYRLHDPEHPVPLALGMFVGATIEGVFLEDVFVLPRTALRDDSQVYVLDDEDKLHFVDATVVRTERERVVLRTQLPAGTRFVVSPLEIATDGMQVTDLATDNKPEADQ
jgi:multidrug efflux system membrane fusion protein